MSTYPATVRSHAKPRSSRSLVAWVALGAAVVGAVFVIALVADDSGPSRTITPGLGARPIGAHARFDGGPNEGTRGAVAHAQADSAVVRFDGGPQEGSRGIVLSSSLVQAPSSSPVQTPTFDRGPRAGRVGEPPSHTEVLTPTASSTRFDGGPDEGTRGTR